MINLQDFIFRIKQTSLGEVAYRASRKMLAVQLKNAVLKRELVVTVPPWRREWVQKLEMPRFDFPPQAANTNSNGISSAGGTPATLNTDLDSIRTFENASRNLFFTSINRLCDGIDIRSVWEPARLQHLTRPLAEERSDKLAAHEQVLQWIRSNPFLLGPHYMSPMECGLRIPVFLYCLKIMADGRSQDAVAVAEAIYQHAWWIFRNLSLYNSLGNHTICESIGLVFAGVIFFNTREGERWLVRSCCLLNQEIKHQILPDGGPAEQSLNYHRFVLDLYWLAVDLLERNKIYDCGAWKPRLELGEHFLRCFELPGGGFPSIGDSDDGYALGPGLKPHRETSQSLQEVPYHLFRDSGYTVLNGPAGSKLIFDHGPLGMAPLYNHGHADALSVLLSVRGVPLLIDPGTYRYNGVPEWRRYFKSTRAHNTVLVDDQDQAVHETGFIWSKPWHIFDFSLNKDDSGITLRAAHDGYHRLSSPVIHHRSIQQDASGYRIVDTFSGKGWHNFELNYHLHPDTALEEHNGTWLLRQNGASCRIRLEEGTFTLSSGLENPIKGWFSPAYGQKVPCPVLSCRLRTMTHQAKFVTRIEL